MLGFKSQHIIPNQEHESHTKLENSTNAPEVVLGLENAGQKRLWFLFDELNDDITNYTVEIVDIVQQLQSPLWGGKRRVFSPLGLELFQPLLEGVSHLGELRPGRVGVNAVVVGLNEHVPVDKHVLKHQYR